MSCHTPPTAEHKPAPGTCQLVYSSCQPTDHPGTALMPNGRPGTERSAPAGFTALPNAVLLATNLSRDARLLYALLLHHAWQDRHCFPSHATLAAELGAGETMLRAYLCELEHAGLITCYRRGQGRTNVYVLHHVCQRAKDTAHAPARMQDAASEPASGKRAVLAGPEMSTVDETQEQTFSTSQRVALEPHQTVPNEYREYIQEQHTDLDRSKLRTQLTPGVVETGPDLRCSAVPTQEAAAPAAHLPAPRAGTVHQSDVPSRAQIRVDPVYLALVEPVSKLADELGDGAPLRSTISRAYNLLRRSGLSCQDFLTRLAEARAIAWAYRSCVTARSSGHDGRPRANLLPYCFAVLERLLCAHLHAPQPRRTPCIAEHASEPVREPNPLWRAVLEELQTILAPAVFTRCWAGRVVSQQANLLQVAVPDRVTLHWFDTRLRRALEDALATVGEEGMQVQFVLQAG